MRQPTPNGTLFRVLMLALASLSWTAADASAQSPPRADAPGSTGTAEEAVRVEYRRMQQSLDHIQRWLDRPDADWGRKGRKDEDQAADTSAAPRTVRRQKPAADDRPMPPSISPDRPFPETAKVLDRLRALEAELAAVRQAQQELTAQLAAANAEKARLLRELTDLQEQRNQQALRTAEELAVILRSIARLAEQPLLKATDGGSAQPEPSPAAEPAEASDQTPR